MKTQLKIHVVLFIFLLSICCINHADAHKVRVFAYESGGMIITEAKFNSGRPAKNSTVTVSLSDGTNLLEGTTDEEGIFRFSPPAEAMENQLDLTIAVDLGEGHKGVWQMNAEDYLGISLQEKQKTDPPSSPTLSQLEKNTPPLSIKNNECSEIQTLIQQTVASELAPVKRILAENMTKKTSLQDILGGLGYIFGLAGIAAYFRYKKTGEKQ